ncbi:DEAH box polypeptide 16 [Thecamonas trahens ATCC 50062]|uniref:RNA helicase n=1 Tax=Thecamonas trahens ATCC 50062 TaxID=461836 RepID=A0A0L0DBI6_THETB|nr:DEAH box polypeptide 16 [Thecamonas trahens ATCC 50062]KNC49585.1 DEAH box polypeptide 16 [Thecamonas trahens ATCC 50062]|eukprot:XP_013757693.1 DEAH box polypeptide 16 [Thecamonas trahens ATCC 50062]
MAGATAGRQGSGAKGGSDEKRQRQGKGSRKGKGGYKGKGGRKGKGRRKNPQAASAVYMDPASEAEAAQLAATAEELRTVRRSLPIFSGRKKLIKALRATQVAVVVGETGSGKSTQLPQYLFEAGMVNARSRVAITQPRVVAATSVAARVAAEVGTRVGDVVGYRVRFEHRCSAGTVIKFLTDGMMLREAIADDALSEYGVIVLDEAHERTVHTDVLLGLLKSLLQRRPELKLVIMSATLDASAFASFFDSAPVLYVTGRTYPVQTFYAAEPLEDYIDGALTTVLQVHEDLAEAPGDMLVFLTGQAEIEALQTLLEERAPLLDASTTLKMEVLPLYAALHPDEQAKVFLPPHDGVRKVVLSTNIAETSITINGITTVIDCGLVKTRAFNPRIGVETLMIMETSQAQARQRAGRAGREQPGRAFRLYPESAFSDLPAQPVPEIRRANLASVILLLKAVGVDDVLNFDYMEPPSIESLTAALEQLYLLGALESDGRLSALGVQMSRFPLEPRFSKMLLASAEHENTAEIITVLAMLSVESIFFYPKDKMGAVGAVLRRYSAGGGDHVMLLNVYKVYVMSGRSAKWCTENYVTARSMRKVDAVRKQLVQLARGQGLDPTASSDDSEALKKALLAGAFMDVALLQPDGSYKTAKSSRAVLIHPSSVLFRAKKAQALLYNELLLTSRQFMRTVTRINPKWLPEIAPGMYAYDVASGSSAATGGSRGQASGSATKSLAQLKAETAAKKAALSTALAEMRTGEP